MFNPKQDKKGGVTFMGFDLQKDMEDPEKLKSYLAKAEKNILEIKNQLRQGTKPEEYENFGTLLHGYSALLKILTSSQAK